MELSLICPVKHIEWTHLLPGRFCIATVADRFSKYREYFVKARKNGYRVILDNGIFEDEQLSDTQYTELANVIRPAVLVVPDTIGGNAEKNWKRALDFAQRFRAKGYGTELMFVPQCEPNDIQGFKNALEEAIVSEQFKWIGICRDAVYNAFGQYTHTTDQELNRFYFSAWFESTRISNPGHISVPLPVVARRSGKKFHFLGVGEKLWLLKQHWYVDSMDTASLFFQSTLGYRAGVKSTLPGGIKRPRDYFVQDFGPEDRWSETLRSNCRVALYWASEAGRLRQRIEGGRL